MRILCCLNRDLPANFALNLLLRELTGHEVRIALTERVGSIPSDEPPQRRELRTAEQALPNELFFPLIERAGLDPDEPRFLTFREMQTIRGIPVDVIQNPNVGAGLQLIQAFAPDLILSIRYGGIFRSPVLSIPRLGVLNLHSGLLPNYRGILATFRALFSGDAEIGCTVHYIGDASIDTGDIVSTCRVRVDPAQTLLRHILELYPPGVAILASAVQALARGEQLSREHQARDCGAYFTYPTAEEWNEFSKRGWLIAQPSDFEWILRRYVPRTD